MRLSILVMMVLVGCSGAAGGNGEQGPSGPPGPKGDPGEQGPQGPPGDVADSFTPGSRITRQILTWTGADGFKSAGPSGLYDTKIEASCSPARAEDDVTRCLPAMGYVQYIDAACSTAVHAQTACAEVPSHVSEIVTDAACGSYILRPRPVGASVAPAAVWALVSNGVCTTSTVLPSPYVYFDLGAPLPPSEFVAIDSTTDP